MADSNKRKERPRDVQGDRGAKRSKGGSGGKWQTPHQKQKAASRGSGRIEPGDAGIWATCARNQEGRATEELKVMFEECAERFYGIKPDSGGEDAEDDDIEASIQKEIAALDGIKKSTTKLISPVHIDVPCVMFFKTRHPIDPVDFVYRICKEIVAKPNVRKMKYVNRLTPVSLIAKATEKSLEELGRTVLGKHFTLNAASDGAALAGEQEAEDTSTSPSTDCSYAIRPTIRNHTAPLNRDIVIKQIAESIADTHKVDLTAADKTIVIEVFQSVCGMSVVGSDWEALKRFNLAELYVHEKIVPLKSAAAPRAEATPESVTARDVDVVAEGADAE